MPVPALNRLLKGFQGHLFCFAWGCSSNFCHPSGFSTFPTTASPPSWTGSTVTSAYDNQQTVMKPPLIASPQRAFSAIFFTFARSLRASSAAVQIKQAIPWGPRSRRLAPVVRDRRQVTGLEASPLDNGLEQARLLGVERHGCFQHP